MPSPFFRLHSSGSTNRTQTASHRSYGRPSSLSTLTGSYSSRYNPPPTATSYATYRPATRYYSRVANSLAAYWSDGTVIRLIRSDRSLSPIQCPGAIHWSASRWRHNKFIGSLPSTNPKFCRFLSPVHPPPPFFIVFKWISIWRNGFPVSFLWCFLFKNCERKINRKIGCRIPT